MIQPEASIYYIRDRVVAVLRTITIDGGDDGAAPKFSVEPSELIHVYFRGADEGVEQRYPATFLSETPAQNLPPGSYRVVLYDKSELEGGVAIRELKCTHKQRFLDETDVARARGESIALENARVSSDLLREHLRELRDENKALRDENKALRDDNARLREEQTSGDLPDLQGIMTMFGLAPQAQDPLRATIDKIVDIIRKNEGVQQAISQSGGTEPLRALLGPKEGT